jgi:hypothetical protein
MDDLVRDRLTLAVEDALEAGHDAHAIVDALLDGIRLGIGGNAPPEPLGDDLSAINPENLLRLPREQFAALFAAQFPDLVKRNAEIVAGGKERQAAHGHGKKPIADEADSLDVTQWLRVADDHLKEVGEAAERVTQPLFQAHRAAVGWFKGLREDVEALRGVGKNPALGTLQQMQTAFLIAKARAERERQLQAQRDAEDRAAAALKEANERQAAEVALAPAQITEDVLAATDEAIAAAQAASAEAAEAARATRSAHNGCNRPGAIRSPTKRCCASRSARRHSSTPTCKPASQRRARLVRPPSMPSWARWRGA